MKRDMFVNRINEQEPPPVMNNDKLMRLVYTSFGISPETTFEEANKQFKEKLNNVSLILSKVETIAEIDYNKTIESIRAYLTARGLALPKDFKAFWHWYVRHYGNSIDDYELNITQEQINEYSRELTAKLDYKPLFKYRTLRMKEPDKLYYLEPPHETERTKEIKQCILHIHNRVRAEEKGRALYHFDIHQFLSVQGITADLKAEILAEVRNTLRFFPEDKRADTEQIRAIINDYQPTQPQPTPHQTESNDIEEVLRDIFKDINTEDISKLKDNLLRGHSHRFWNVFYKGTKRALWYKLGLLRDAGINRNDIARVFDEIHWQKVPFGASVKLDYNEIYTKIDKRGTKRG